MGGKSSKKVYTDLTNAGVSPDLATKLAKGAKLKGTAAKNFLKVILLLVCHKLLRPVQSLSTFHKASLNVLFGEMLKAFEHLV